MGEHVKQIAGASGQGGERRLVIPKTLTPDLMATKNMLAAAASALMGGALPMIGGYSAAPEYRSGFNRPGLPKRRRGGSASRARRSWGLGYGGKPRSSTKSFPGGALFKGSNAAKRAARIARKAAKASGRSRRVRKYVLASLKGPQSSNPFTMGGMRYASVAARHGLA